MGFPFSKYHALGNDYLVIHERDLRSPLSPEIIRRICDRNYGVGSDGIVLIAPQTPNGFPVRIYNPDGSEAEISGNGMRIAARYLFDCGLVDSSPFNLLAGGSRIVRSEVLGAEGAAIRVEMGQATFLSSRIPVLGNERLVLKEQLMIDGEVLTYSCVNVGNPHCVIFMDGSTNRHELKSLALKFGPRIEAHKSFPNRTNVQFASIVSDNCVDIEIWERGAGYTLASGSSSCAVAAVGHKLGLLAEQVTVKMPGGELSIVIHQDDCVTLEGPVHAVYTGKLCCSVDRYFR